MTEEKSMIVNLTLYPEIIEALETVYEINGAEEYHQIISAAIAYLSRINAGEPLTDPEEEAAKLIREKKGKMRPLWSAYIGMLRSINRAAEYKQSRSEIGRGNALKRHFADVVEKYTGKIDLEVMEIVAEYALQNAQKNPKAYFAKMLDRLIAEGKTTIEAYRRDLEDHESRKAAAYNPALKYQQSEIPDDLEEKLFKDFNESYQH